MPKLLLIANPENRRATMFLDAWRRRTDAPVVVVPYLDLFDGRSGWEMLDSAADDDTVVRIESPGENFDVERQLLALGSTRAEEEGIPSISAQQAESLEFDHGRILYPRQWYLGFCRLLEKIGCSLPEGVRYMNPPADIALMFDKPSCHARCLEGEIPVPQSLGAIGSCDELIARMDDAGIDRVFVKIANGSSASGVAAVHRTRSGTRAVTTVEMTDDGRYYNSLKLQCYREPTDLARLIDWICSQQAHVERWLPKAVLGRMSLDLRVVVIAGHARHTVVRQSTGPMTNLHLGGRRGDLDALKEKIGPARWQAVQRTCERVMTLFPGSLYAGIDVLLLPGGRSHAILEANTFGDLLPGVLCDGMDTYEAETMAVAVRE